MAGRRVSLPPLAPAAASAGVVDVLTGAQPQSLPVPTVPAGPLSVEDAQELTERIRATARQIGEQIGRLRELVEQAREGQVWLALGFASWTAYLSATLEPMRLPRAERREVVGYLTLEGMSTRAIAPIVSADPKTVGNDRRALAAVAAEAGGEVSPPAPAGIIGRDGRQYDAAPRRHLVVVGDPALAPRYSVEEQRARTDAARLIATARRERTTGRPSTFHAAAIFERAGDAAARSCATFLARGSDELAREVAATYVLLDDRRGAALRAGTGTAATSSTSAG